MAIQAYLKLVILTLVVLGAIQLKNFKSNDIDTQSFLSISNYESFNKEISELQKSGNDIVNDLNQFIITNYNNKTFDNIYFKFNKDLQKNISYNKFNTFQSLLRNELGPVLGNFFLEKLDTQTVKNCSVFQYSFLTNLDLGLLLFCLDQNSDISQFQLKPDTSVSAWNYINSVKGVGVGIEVNRNGVQEIKLNEDQFFPIMSTYKVGVVLEYARQVSSGILNPEQTINITDLNNFYLEGFDNAHQNWLNLMQAEGRIQNGTVSLHYVAYGMVNFSSNCNTEYLQTLLGLDNITQILFDNDVPSTQNMYLVSSMLALNNSQDLPYVYWIRQISQYTHNQLVNLTLAKHAEFIKNPNLRKQCQWLKDPKVMQIYTDLFVRSSANSWNHINSLINQNKFNSKMQDIIYDIYGVSAMAIDNPRAKPFTDMYYLHAGVKGGSSAYPNQMNCALANSWFVQDKFGNKIEIFWVYSNLTWENYQIRLSDMNRFSLALQFDSNFTSEFKNKLSQFSY